MSFINHDLHYAFLPNTESGEQWGLWDLIDVTHELFLRVQFGSHDHKTTNDDVHTFDS